MNSERVINITSDKYHVTGTLEDYGVVIKLHFNFNGVSRTVGISRPLTESLEEKGLQMMEATIEQLSEPGKVTLHYWYIDLHNEKRIAHGLVTGHPRVEDTHLIHTSPVKNISMDYDAEEVLIETKNRVYHCPLAYCKFQKQDTNPDLLPDYTTLKENYSNRIVDPEIEHGKVLLVLSDFDDSYFHSLCVKDDSGRVEHYETYNHIGMFQDSFLIMGEHVDLRYFPHYKSIEFYSDDTGEMPLFIENIGSCDLYARFRGETYCIHAGERKELSPENAESDAPRLPDGDLYPAGT